jgi:coenzyme F420-0:L-glutamate ligase / coenzyme F420-1:gamma-L-glutamate ligase
MIDLSPDDITFLRQARVAHLATASAAGEPHAIPVCFALDGNHLYTAIDAKPKRVPRENLRRVKNLRENPHVSLVVDHYEEDWTRLRYVLILGRADVVEAGPDWQAAWRLLREKYPQYQAMPDLGRGPVIRIVPERVVAWQSGPQSSDG